MKVSHPVNVAAEDTALDDGNAKRPLEECGIFGDVVGNEGARARACARLFSSFLFAWKARTGVMLSAPWAPFEGIRIEPPAAL